MYSIVTTFRGADIKVEVANFCAAMDTLIDQDAFGLKHGLKLFENTKEQIMKVNVIHTYKKYIYTHFGTAHSTQNNAVWCILHIIKLGL